MNNIKSLLYTQFNVRPYSILSSFLHSCISNYIGTFLHSFIGLTIPILYIHGSLPLHAAILICLEHSFWIAQQGFNPDDGFMKAWKFYLNTQRALVDQELDDYLRSKGSYDWFTMKYCPSEQEYAECRKIVFNNLLCKSSPCLL